MRHFLTFLYIILLTIHHHNYFTCLQITFHLLAHYISTHLCVFAPICITTFNTPAPYHLVYFISIYLLIISSPTYALSCITFFVYPYFIITIYQSVNLSRRHLSTYRNHSTVFTESSYLPVHTSTYLPVHSPSFPFICCLTFQFINQNISLSSFSLPFLFSIFACEILLRHFDTAAISVSNYFAMVIKTIN